MKKISLLFLALFISATALFAQPIYNEDGIRLYHTPSQEEIEWAKSKGLVEPVSTPVPPPTGQLRPIAEWEPAEAVLIAYPFGIPISLIKEMAKDITVITIVASSSQQSTVLSQYTSNGVNTANCKFLIAASDTYWTRDYGPWFMAIDNNEVAMFDFYYNRPARPNDNQINTYLKTYLSNNGKPIERYASNLWLTGGNYMNDGLNQGYSTTLVTTENLQNLGYTEQQVKQQLHDYLGHEQYHFIADCIVPYDNIQHIDCWGKLLGPDKVLIDSVAPGANNFAKFQAAANYFRAQTSAYGTPYKVYRVFAPGATSSSPKTPYSNSLILNNKVFVPVNSTPSANDNAALQVFMDAMPGYEVIGIPYGSWLNTDALHCRTHEIADRCMLYINHQPLCGNIPNTGAVTFEANIYSYCQNNINPDSVLVYVKHGGGNYAAHKMALMGDNKWEVTVAGLPSGLVEYYVFAKDNTGKRETHPYIARYAPNADPHKFTLTSPLPALAINKTSSSVTSDGFKVIEDYITVSNVGTAELTCEIKDIVFDNMFTVTPLDCSIQPGGSQTLTLRYNFAGVANGEYNGSFKLLSNDPSHPVTQITLHATQNVTAEIPVLCLSKTSSSVYTEEITIVEDYITVSNLGNTNLTFEIKEIDFNDMFSIEPQTGTVPKNDSLILTLTYNFNNPAKVKEYSGSFKLFSNDPENPKVEVSLLAVLNLGIKGLDFSKILIYPNPANNELRVTSYELQITDVEIYDVLGRMQKAESRKEKGEREVVIDVSHLSSGFYFVKVAGNTYKFIKQ